MKRLLQRTLRRRVGAALVVLGAVTMVLAPDSSGGLVVLAVAIALELAGLVLEQRD